MRAAIYYGKEDIRMEERDKPEIGVKDILVKNLCASICGTDVAVYTHGPGTGHRVTVGGEFGHEVVSEVVEVGSEVTDIQVGDRIYPYPREAKRDPKRAGTLGGFSEYMLLPEPKWREQIYRVSDQISDRAACLIEPFTVGCRAARRSQPKAGEHAVVFGAGTIGIAAAGSDSILELWQQMGKIESRMVVVAVLAGKRPVDILHMTFAQHTLIGSGGYMPEDVDTVMEIMESGRWDIESVITHEFAWEDLQKAIETAGNVEQALNVIIRY